MKIAWDIAGMCFFGWILYSGIHDPHRDWFSLIFPAFIEFGGLMALLYLVGGRTQLEFSQESLVIKVVILGIPQRKKYSISDMGEPHWTEVTDERQNGPQLEFDYNGQDIRACPGISMEEVEQAVAAVRGLYPDAARRWDRGTPLRSKVFTTLGLS